MFIFADINECVVMTGLCGDHEVCNDTDGSYTCSCEEGYERDIDGQDCRKSKFTKHNDIGLMVYIFLGSSFQAGLYVIVIGISCAAAAAAVLVAIAGLLICQAIKFWRKAHRKH